MSTAPNPLYTSTRFRVESLLDRWPVEFVIITAYAPTGQKWTDAENIAANHKLEAELASRDVWRLRITGYSLDTGHAEPGWAVELPIGRGREIGRRFQQDAIFVIRADALGYIRCEGDGKVTWFGEFRKRVGAGLL